MAIEKELKYFLNERDFSTLLKSLRKTTHKSVHHINYYFDNDKLSLRKKRFGLRVRYLDQKQAIVTLKHPARKKGPTVPSLKVRHEYEEIIPMKIAEALIKGKLHITEISIYPIKVLKEHFPKDVLNKVYALGSITNTRHFAIPEKNIEFELDAFQMFKEKFFELEIETSNPARADKTVRRIFHDLHIPYHPIEKSKLGRFIGAWRKLR